VGLCVGCREIKPARPGAREPYGGMALRVCVRHVAPAFKPNKPSLYVAVEWPMDTLMSCAVRSLIRELESGSSGARVTSLTEDEMLEEP